LRGQWRKEQLERRRRALAATEWGFLGGVEGIGVRKKDDTVGMPERCCSSPFKRRYGCPQKKKGVINSSPQKKKISRQSMGQFMV